jgi:predicted DNA-binding transcriptional regulator AlpA
MNTLRAKSVAKKLDVSISTVWNLTKRDLGFPKPFKLVASMDTVVWDEADIDLYLLTRKHGDNHGNAD